MLKLTDKEYSALVAICDAVVPTIDKADDTDGYWVRTASDLQIADKIVDVIGKLTRADQQNFKKLCKILASPLLGLTWFGPLKPAYKLSMQERTRLLRKWANSPLGDLRNGFSNIKKLTGFFYFGSVEQDHENPNWKSLQYSGQLNGNFPAQATIPTQSVNKDTVLSADVVIIGSGAGGSVVAAELAAMGKQVIVLEKGPYLRPEEITQREEEMMRQLYDSAAALATTDGNMGVLAGSCLGGGTTVNWAGAFRTPPFVLEEWANDHGNPHFLSEDYQRGFEHIETRCHITTRLLKHNPQNYALESGAKALGYLTKIIPRNVYQPEGMDSENYWKVQGYSPHGDRYGIKQGAVQTFLQDATAAGAQVYVDTEVQRVLTENGKAVGVLAKSRNASGKVVTLKINAPTVVMAAGAIHSPAILKRSGLEHPEIGRNLYLHPTSAVSGHYTNAIESWYGPMMSAVCDEFVQLDGNFGFKLETPPAHPGLMATALNWQNGEQFKTDMLNVRHQGTFIILTRDKFGGEVIVDKEGRPQPKYNISPFDKKHMLRGIQEAVRIHAAAGAERINVLNNKPIIYKANGETDLEEFVSQIPGLNWKDNHYFLASAHQMGTCRMGGSDKLHPVRPDGETREVKNLYVADTSAFPSASGANPMLSVQALAYYIAQRLKEK